MDRAFRLKNVVLRLLSTASTSGRKHKSPRPRRPLRVCTAAHLHTRPQTQIIQPTIVSETATGNSTVAPRETTSPEEISTETRGRSTVPFTCAKAPRPSAPVETTGCEDPFARNCEGNPFFCCWPPTRAYRIQPPPHLLHCPLTPASIDLSSASYLYRVFLLRPPCQARNSPARSGSAGCSRGLCAELLFPRPSGPPRTSPTPNVARPRVAQIEPGGSAVTLETSEPLFQVAAALNACGYDADLATSSPVRREVRRRHERRAGRLRARTRDARDRLCAYVTEHRLSDRGLDIGQYVSLSLYLSPPPELTPNVDETDLPPQALQVVNVLPLLRTFSEEAGLHVIWLRHRAEYEELAARVHDPMTAMILASNIYLHQPVSSYDGRRFLVLLEPMLSPALTNARIYGSDYIIVTSPDASAGDPVHMDEIRHIYLHYVVEPMTYSRGSAMERLEPILRSVADAPLDFTYKSDFAALLTECLIKGY